MNYTNIYEQLVAKRKVNPAEKSGLGTIERHHVIPKSMGGDNSLDNIVILTAREHYIAHRLLAKMYPDSGMPHAVFQMVCFDKKGALKVTSRTYQRLRESHAKRVSENLEANLKKSESKRGKPQSAKHVAKRILSRKAKGPWCSDKTSRRISEGVKRAYAEGKLTAASHCTPEQHERGVAKRKANGSYKWTETQREKMAESRSKPRGPMKDAHKERIRQTYTSSVSTCPHCGVSSYRMNMARWHFDNCKHNLERKNDAT